MKNTIQEMKVEQFEISLISEADYSQPYNGNNGNYEFVSVYAKGVHITDSFVSDYTVVTDQFVFPNEFGILYQIIDNKVIMSDDGDDFCLATDGQFYPYNLSR